MTSEKNKNKKLVGWPHGWNHTVFPHIIKARLKQCLWILHSNQFSTFWWYPMFLGFRVPGGLLGFTIVVNKWNLNLGILKSIYEGRWFVCLSHWDLPNKSTSCHLLDDTVGKPLMSTGAPSWFGDVSTYGEEVIEYWEFSPLKIHSNQN